MRCEQAGQLSSVRTIENMGAPTHVYTQVHESLQKCKSNT